jgi:tetratricopeptide (TPR) repeat protein
VYHDRFNRIRHRIVHPRYHFGIHYRCGPYFSFRYFWPYYHRKYVFVSLGGYWPADYYYRRYYWYGYHPYSWYGYYPIAREVQGDTQNYYTYNYYGTNGVATAGDYGESGIDHNTFADVRERLAQQPAEGPARQTLADTYFEDGVKAFEIGGYGVAAEKFAKAMELAPDDIILPFAYSQALLADGKYIGAVEVLRTALLKVTPEKEGVFYPRGLYPDEEKLFAQIDRLTEKADLDKSNADLQLLLGYQLLGIGETEAAVESLQQARLDPVNSEAAKVLLELAAKLKTEDSAEK